MFYKEFLRVRNAFIPFAICLVSLALLVFLLSGHAKHVHVNVDTNANHVHAIHSSATSHRGSSDTNEVQAPGIHVENSDDLIPVVALFVIAAFIAAIFGTVLGCCLASENCGHLDVAWTRPVSRVAYAARLMVVDVAGIVAMFAFSLLLIVGLIYASGWQGFFVASNDVWPMLARCIAYALAWFALVAALTASVRTKAGAIAGFSWIAATLLISMLAFKLPPAVHTIVLALDHINPLYYGSYSTGPDVNKDLNPSTPFALSGLLGITLVGIAAALAQWRRLEA